jgi:hypothetical protein
LVPWQGRAPDKTGQDAGCPMALKELARVGGGLTPHCPCQGFCTYYSTYVLFYKWFINVLRFLIL